MTRCLLAALLALAALVMLLLMLPIALALALPALLWDEDGPPCEPDRDVPFPWARSQN